MGQTILTRVLGDIQKLELSDLPLVERAVQDRLEMAGYTAEEWKAMQSLVDDGLLTDIKPRRQDSSTGFSPVSIRGDPLSRTVIEERR